jgi:O-antigen biosynthesis protein
MLDEILRLGTGGRVSIDGKHLSLDGRPFRVRGVTYGTFAARDDGALFPPPERVRADFNAMARAGINTVRMYTVPPPDVIELGEEAGLRFLVGLHYDDWRLEPQPGRGASKRVLAAGLRAIDNATRALAGRPSIVGISVGNEIPADVVRVHGVAAVERILARLVSAVQDADAELLATYTNFPTTEFLNVEGQDFVSFNLFLERRAQLRPYLRRLMVLAQDRPLLVTELGLAAGVHGTDAQAESLAWQLREIDEAGAAGATVFSWTDDWVVAGTPVGGWGFGLTDAERGPKPALEVVSTWARSGIRDLRDRWPTVTAVVCVRNGASFIAECLSSLEASDYPGLEVIVCDDGSSDETVTVAQRFPFRVLRLAAGGLARARNAGLAAARGEVVAFIDADASCHPEWPYFIALSLEEEKVAATGGPNLPSPEAGLIERAVSGSPGGPTEVLVRDDRAEHVPGCNMAFVRQALVEIGGFDPVFVTAGDDVDVCWRLLDRGHEIAFAPAAVVRHRRRDTVRGFVRQQFGYGRAEALLAGRHRHRFNRLGQARWAGFVYGGAPFLRSLLRPVVYHGTMGTAPFQPIVRRRSEATLAWLQAHLPLALMLVVLGLLAPLSAWWIAAPAVALVFLLGYATVIAVGVRPARAEARPTGFRMLVALLHVVQPLARAIPRASRRPSADRRSPGAQWRGDRAAWLAALGQELQRGLCAVRIGGPNEKWDLEASVGLFVRARIATAVVWSWQPLHRAWYRPRRSALALCGGAIALALFSPLGGLVGLAILGAGTALEAVLLGTTVRRAVSRTTPDRTGAESQFNGAADPAITAEGGQAQAVALAGSLASPDTAYEVRQ